MEAFSQEGLLELTAEIVSAYVRRNSLPVAELPGLLEKLYDTLGQISSGREPIEDISTPLTPAVPIKKSITDDYIISLENGQKFKSLKRHLMTTYGMTPDQYRVRWGLPPTYPMVAPNYAKSRAALAVSLGLGRKAAVPEPAITETTTAATKPRRGRPAKAA